MNMIFWKLAFRGLFRNKKRSAITAIAFIVGFTGLFVLAGYIGQVEKTLKSQAIYIYMNGHLVIRKATAEDYWTNPKKFLIKKEDAEEIRSYMAKSFPEIEYIGSRLRVASQITSGDKTFPILIDGLDMDAEAKSRSHKFFKKWFEGFYGYWPRPFKKTKTGEYGISITPSLARLLNVNVFSEQDDIDLESQIVGLDFESSLNAIDVQVNKIHKSPSDFAKDLSVEMDIKTAQSFVNNEGFAEINVFLKDESDMQSIKDKMIPFLNQRFKGEYSIERYDTEEISPEYIGNMGILSVMFGFFVFLIGGAVVLSVLNVLMMSIYERSAEIGTLLSLGFQKIQVRMLFVAEALILGVTGIAIGTVLSVLISGFINSLKLEFYPPGGMGRAFVTIDFDFIAGAEIGCFMLGLLILASYLVTKTQTNKNLVQLLYEVDGKS